MDEPLRPPLRQEMDVNDEEGLLRLQEEFLSSKESARPAARVTRVHPARTSAQRLPCHTPPVPASMRPERGPVSTATAAGKNAPAIPKVLSDVVERPTALPTLPQAPRVPQSSRPFPAVQHRAKSKFALGRIRQAQDCSAAVSSSSTPGPTPHGLPASSMQAGTGTDTVQQQQQQFGHSDMMLQGIHEENEARLAAMSADELDDARAELAARFSPASLEFLKSRRQQQQQQQVGAGAGSSVDAKGSSAAAARRGATPAVSRGLHGGCTGKASAAAAMTTSSTPSAVTTTDHAVGPLQQHNAPGVPVQLPPSQPTNLPPVARLRFGVEGELLSVDLPGAAAIQDADVLMRDSLSRATGTVPQGYSLPELRALLRSAHAPQRATGYRLLGTLLRRSRPGLHVLGEDGQLLPRPALLDLVPGGDSQQQRQQEQRQQEQQQQQQQSRDTGADWTQIWQYLLVALRAAALIRLGLDDDAAQVLAAAADAAAALLGQDPQEAVLGEAAACASALGWPCSWRTSLRRLNSSGAWESVAGLVAAAAATTTSGGGSRGGALGQHNADTDADTDTPEDLAAVDPLAGFLRMDPLPRLRFVLQRRSDSDAVLPLLLVLEAVAASSRAAAEAVVRCKGMPDALMALLGVPLGAAAATVQPRQMNGQHNDHQPQGEEDAQQPCGFDARAGLRVAVLRLLRILCSSSPLAAQLLRTAGLDAAVTAVLCSSSSSILAHSSSSSSSSDSGSAQRPGSIPCGATTAAAAAATAADEVTMMIKLEALRVWRVCAAHGVALAHVDAMFPALAPLLQPPAEQQQAHGITPAIEQLRLLLCAESFQLLDVLVRHGVAVERCHRRALGPPMLTPGCAAAVAADAASAWLSMGAEPLARIARAIVTKHGQALPRCLLPYDQSPWMAAAASYCAGDDPGTLAASRAAELRGLAYSHASLLLPPAAAALAALAGVLGFMASYWSSLDAAPQQMQQELAKALSVAGFLPLPSSSTSSSGSDALLAAVLLTEPLQQEQLGGALLHHCTDLLAAAGPRGLAPQQQQQQQQRAAGGYEGGHSSNPVAAHTLALPACCLLLAVTELHYAQARLRHSAASACDQIPLPAPARAALQAASSNCISWVGHIAARGGGGGGGVGGGASAGASAAVMAAATVSEPWTLAQAGCRQYQLRLVLRLSTLLLRTGQQPLGKQQQQWQRQQQQQYPCAQQQQQQQHVLAGKGKEDNLLWRAFDGLLCVLPLSAPGHEVQALQALQLLFPAVAAPAPAPAPAPSAQSGEAAGSAVSGGGGRCGNGRGGCCALAARVLPAAARALWLLATSGDALGPAAAGLRADTLPAEVTAGGGGKGSCCPYWPWLLAHRDLMQTAAAAAAAAAAATEDSSTTSSSAKTGAAAAAAREWASLLAQGYAATWLSVVQQQQPAEEQEQQQQYPCAQQLPQLPLQSVMVDAPEGSRLPTPPEWLLSEVLALPQQQLEVGATSSSTSSAAELLLPQPPPLHPAGAAMLLALGLEELSSSSSSSILAHSSNSSSSAYMAALPAGTKLQALLDMLYVFDAGQLLQEQARVSLVPAWQDADARWAAAALTTRYCQSVMDDAAAAAAAATSRGTGGSGNCIRSAAAAPGQTGSSLGTTSGCSLTSSPPQQPLLLLPRWAAAPQLVDGVVRDLADLSTGDQLFAAHIALLLLPAAGARLQRTAWASLSQHACLHLLPTPSRCVLGAGAYLRLLGQPRQLLGGGGGGSSSVCMVDAAATASAGTAAAAAAAAAAAVTTGVAADSAVAAATTGAACGGFDEQLVGDMGRSLSQGELRKALRMGSLAGVLALHGIAALCLDQRVWRSDVRVAGGGAAAGDCLAVSISNSPLLLGESQRRASAASIAVNVLRGALRSCDNDVLAGIMTAADVRGLPRTETSRALMQVAHGDAQLMEKARRLLVECGVQG